MAYLVSTPKEALYALDRMIEQFCGDHPARDELRHLLEATLRNYDLETMNGLNMAQRDTLDFFKDAYGDGFFWPTLRRQVLDVFGRNGLRGSMGRIESNWEEGNGEASKKAQVAGY